MSDLIGDIRRFRDELLKPPGQKYIIFTEQSYKSQVDESEMSWEELIKLDSVHKCENAIDQTSYYALWPQIITELNHVKKK